MSYRLYIQPLTEKTKSLPLDNELVVNTENTNISVMNNNKLISAMKDIASDIKLSMKLISRIKDYLEKIQDKLEKLEEKYQIEYNRVQELLRRTDELEKIMEDLLKQLEDIEEINTDNYDRIQYYLKAIADMLPEFFKWMPEILAFRRKIDELDYIKDFLHDDNSIENGLVDLTNEKITVDDITIDEDGNISGGTIIGGTLEELLKSVTENVNSRAYESDYKNYINDLTNKTLALKKEFSSIVVKIDFGFNS